MSDFDPDGLGYDEQQPAIYPHHFIDPPQEATVPITPTIIPNPNPLKVITLDEYGYHVTSLGDEVATVDQATGEVCRKRPAISRIDLPIVSNDVLAAILTSRLRDEAAGQDKTAAMALTLQERANVHIQAYSERAAKIAARRAAAGEQITIGHIKV